jgi:hypothetical protein
MIRIPLDVAAGDPVALATGIYVERVTNVADSRSNTGGLATIEYKRVRSVPTFRLLSRSR